MENKNEKLRCIGYKQTFDVYPFRFKVLRNLFKPTAGWVVRGLHYFYVEEDADIEDIYSNRYIVKKDSITNSWVDTFCIVSFYRFTFSYIKYF